MIKTRLSCTSNLQAYAGDKLGYQKEPIERDMTIALTDAGAVDGADIISEVGMARLPGMRQAAPASGWRMSMCAVHHCRFAPVDVQVVVRGKLCSVVGYGGMNMHMIDISAVPEARVSCFAAFVFLRDAVPFS